jgi:putative membrane protein
LAILMWWGRLDRRATMPAIPYGAISALPAKLPFPDGRMTSAEPNDDLLKSASLELASQQATLAFERHSLSLDQALLAAIRTSIALIGFGFAMVLFFHQVSAQMGVDLRPPARNFGLCLVIMGIALVAVTILQHRRHFERLRARMDTLHERGLLGERFLPKRSYIGIFAQLLLLVGLLVVAGIVIRIGPFRDTTNWAAPPADAAPAIIGAPSA